MRPEIRDRLILPLVIPLGILLVIAIVLLGLSRIFLASPHDVAPWVALSIATAVLFGGTLFATVRISESGTWWLIGVPVLALLAGGVWGQSEYSSASEDHGEGDGGGAVVSGTVEIEMRDNSFRPNAYTVKAAEEVTIEARNTGAAIHNLRIAGADGSYDTGDDIVSTPDIVRAGATATLKATFAAAGTIDFRCDFHPAEMTGKITVVQ